MKRVKRVKLEGSTEDRYNRIMSRAMRIATAAVLVFVVAGFPSVLDRCAATCEAHHDVVGRTPTCHHVTATTTRIGHEATPCGHDHRAAAATSVSSAAPVGRSLGPLIAVVAMSGSFAPPGSDRRLPGHAPPGASLALDARSLPLRI
jgi:hypothetical protein